jgi:hypothetical protein
MPCISRRIVYGERDFGDCTELGEGRRAGRLCEGSRFADAASIARDALRYVTVEETQGLVPEVLRGGSAEGITV